MIRRSHIHRLVFHSAMLMTVMCLLTGCLGKKNTAAKRNYSAFITRYNIYFNGDEHYKETLKKMESDYEDDYSRQVLMHPVLAKSESTLPQPSGNFDRSIEKAQKAIQLRSIKQKPQKKAGRNNDPKYKEFMSREEYNPFIHNAWMMMGRSQYYNGDFLGAASTFFYISRHFKWLPETVIEAKLWQAISYLSMDWVYDADLILSKIKESDITTNTLIGLYNYAKADYLLHRGEYNEAVPYLTAAVDKASGAQKTRLRFLLGQILARNGDKDAAYQMFKKAGSSSSATYRTKFNARIKQSEVFTGQDITPEVNALKRMTRYDLNEPYLDQIYYAIGNLYLSRHDTTHAIENYILAAEKSTRNGIDRAISQLTLGGIYFDRRQYTLAQPCYAEAMPQIPESWPDYKMLKKRSDVLDQLANYAQNVELQDSLLRLSEMSEEQRNDIIENIIQQLREREEKERQQREREEFLAQRMESETNTGQAANSPNSFQLNNDKSWYFYNTTTRTSGKTAFQRKWGARKLEDDWRRRNKNTFDSSSFDSDNDSSHDNDDAGDNPADSTAANRPEGADDPYNPQYYLKDIPFTQDAKDAAHQIIQEGLYNMGLILKDRLDDMPGALEQFDRLLKDYPDNTYRLDIYYNIYLMAMRHDDKILAEKYRQLILSDFPDSKYGEALKNPDYIENLKKIDSVTQQLYADTYKAYLDNDNASVHRAYSEMTANYPTAAVMPKFMFLEALAYVPEKQPEKFNAVLRELLERYPDTDLTPIVSSWLTGMAHGRQLQTDGGNMRGMLWSTRLSNDSISEQSGEGPVFELNEDSPQILVLLFPTTEINSNQLLYEIARHNFKSFVVKDFDLEQLNFGRLGMILIKGFNSLKEVEHYIKVMNASGDIRLPAQVRPVIISAANFKALIDSGSSFDRYFQFLEQQQYEYAQEGLIPKEEMETLEDADNAPAPDSVDIPDAPAPQQPTPASTPQQTGKTTAKQPQKPAPKPTPKPDRPEYDPGSEGDDDPLLD